MSVLGACLFWFVWLTGLFVYTVLVGGTIYVAIDPKRRQYALTAYKIAQLAVHKKQQQQGEVELPVAEQKFIQKWLKDEEKKITMQPPPQPVETKKEL